MKKVFANVEKYAIIIAESYVIVRLSVREGTDFREKGIFVVINFVVIIERSERRSSWKERQECRLYL